MAFFNTPVAALLLLSLSVALSPAAAYATIAEAPFQSPTASPSPAASVDDEALFDAPNSFVVVPKEEQAMDSQYLKAHMTFAAHKVEIFLADEVERRLNDPATTDSDRECLLVCKEVFESAADDMKKGTESVSAGDFIKANFDVSAFTTNIDTCNECFDDFRMFDDWAKHVGSDCLDKIVKYTN